MTAQQILIGFVCFFVKEKHFSTLKKYQFTAITQESIIAPTGNEPSARAKQSDAIQQNENEKKTTFIFEERAQGWGLLYKRREPSQPTSLNFERKKPNNTFIIINDPL